MNGQRFVDYFYYRYPRKIWNTHISLDIDYIYMIQSGNEAKEKMKMDLSLVQKAFETKVSAIKKWGLGTLKWPVGIIC